MVRDLISYIVKALVDQPDQVSVTEVEGGHTVVLEISVAQSDMGKVIGKRGRNAQALRTILNAASGKVRKKYVLEIVDDDLCSSVSKPSHISENQLKKGHTYQ